MPVKSTITLTDSGQTPAAGTPTATARPFVPIGRTGNVHLFENDFTGVSGKARSKLTASLSRASASRPTNRIKGSIALPFVVTDDSGEQVLRVNRANIEYIVHDDAGFDERADLVSVTSSLAANPQFHEMAKKVEDQYSD